jgi:hypothetical protein
LAPSAITVNAASIIGPRCWSIAKGAESILLRAKGSADASTISATEAATSEAATATAEAVVCAEATRGSRHCVAA